MFHLPLNIFFHIFSSHQELKVKESGSEAELETISFQLLNNQLFIPHGKIYFLLAV